MFNPSSNAPMLVIKRQKGTSTTTKSQRGSFMTGVIVSIGFGAVFLMMSNNMTGMGFLSSSAGAYRFCEDLLANNNNNNNNNKNLQGKEMGNNRNLLQQQEGSMTSSSSKQFVDGEAASELFSMTKKYLMQYVDEYRDQYHDASPFPHIAIDNLIPNKILRRAAEELPENMLQNNGCLHNKRCFRDKELENLKSYIDDEDMMGPHTKMLMGFLSTETFIAFLEEMTGIEKLLPDPSKTGSGVHFTASGGKLDIHADFNWQDDYELHRRVNVFIYLNDDWPEEYGGHLELWSRDMKSCMASILPTFGRLVIFSSTDFSYHGHPTPLAAPPGRARRSIAMYYYTKHRPQTDCIDEECEGQHGTLFQKPNGCGKCTDAMCLRFDPNEPQWINALIHTEFDPPKRASASGKKKTGKKSTARKS